jgi:hypothetical protein
LNVSKDREHEIFVYSIKATGRRRLPRRVSVQVIVII